MKILKSITDLRNALDANSNKSTKIGLVPTMGNLHAGHLSLVKEAVASCDLSVSTIFINPLQFGESEDLASYPRTFEQDTSVLNDAGCDFLFAPSKEELYVDSTSLQTKIHVPQLSNMHCGKSRPGHFDGVATVVCKLFNIVQPHLAYFGLKDYQQFLIIRKLVSDLNMPVKIVGIETVREESGLALSSRNTYLSPKQLESATEIYRSLLSAKELILAGNRQYRAIELECKSKLNKAGLKADYFSICNSDNLAPAHPDNDTHIALLAAAYLDSTRLIDNLRFKLQQN